MAFFERSETLLEDLKKSGDIEEDTTEKTKEEKIKEATEKNNLYFQQYLTATQADQTEKAIELLEKQKECQKIMYENDSTQSVSNIYLLAQNKLKVGKFEESLKDSDELIERAEKLKEEFAEDYGVVASKFFVQQANVKFIAKDFPAAVEAAKKGVELCKDIKDDDLEIMRSVNNARRDLLNVLLRATIKLDPSQKSAELRKQISAEHNLDQTFMPRMDLMEVMKKAVG